VQITQAHSEKLSISSYFSCDVIAPVLGDFPQLALPNNNPVGCTSRHNLNLTEHLLRSRAPLGRQIFRVQYCTSQIKRLENNSSCG
jgi:hypothetical protein